MHLSSCDKYHSGQPTLQLCIKANVNIYKKRTNYCLECSGLHKFKKAHNELF